jgi:hypothetical protein
MSRLSKYITLVIILELLLSLAITTKIQAENPAITLSVYSGTYGSAVTVNGRFFNTNDYVTIYFDSTIVVSSFRISGTTFAKSFSVPSAYNGTHTITASGDMTGDASDYFTVSAGITLSKSTGEPGNTITVTGYGYGSYENTITMTFNGSQVGTAVTAGGDGYWTNNFTVPNLTAGTYSLTANGNASNSATASFTLVVTPKITVNKTSGPVGTSITVSGTGFTPGESGIVIMLGGKAVGPVVSASSSGTWSAQFEIPTMPGGTNLVDAYGSTTSASAVSDLSFQITPTVTISPSSAAPGSTVAVEGNGFVANETVTVSYDSTDMLPTFKAGSDGTWSTRITIPAGAAGSHKIYAKGTSTAKTPSAGVDFKLGAGLSLSKTSGPVGTNVTISGSGFAAKEGSINIIFDGTKTAITNVASDTGGWSTDFAIPLTAGGEHKFDAEGKTTTAASIADVSFSVTPEVTSDLADKTEGVSGTTINFSATGFAAGENGITISYDGKQLGPRITADSKGTWKTSLTVPVSPSGQHAFQVNATVTNVTAVGSFYFTVKSNMLISPTDGFVGSQVSLVGTGFAPNSNLRFSFDNTDLNVGLASTDGSGNFSKTITIPKAAGGTHVIRVQDFQGNNFQAVFNMDSTPPAVPKIISPADGTIMGFFGNISPILEWGKVTDPSAPITYNLQLGTDPDFDSTIIDLNNLTSTKYSFKKGETLPRGEYYWHVQAMDSAANASNWTDPILLVSGQMSPVVFALIVIGVVVALAVGGFFLFRLLRRKKKVIEPQTAPEIVIPEVVNAEYKQIEGEKKALPWRLALPSAPQPARGSRSSLSEEDQARLKVIIDFAKSMPLAEPGANTHWLVELAENTTGNCASPALYAQLVKGELQLRYEPAWMKHPTYVDLQTILEGQSLMDDLNAFIDSVNRTASEAETALGDIYQEIVSEVTWDIFANGGWAYISAVYMDSYQWFQGKYLKEPSERDYSIKPETMPSGENGFSLYSEKPLPFAGLLIQVMNEQEALNFRALHLKLRRDFRNNDRIKVVVTSIIQMEVQRNRLINSFKQFNRLTPT